jgi:peptide/nickel transport system permease protein
MSGLAIILLTLLIAIFCYLLVPDKTPDSNTMNLNISLLSPGSKVLFVREPLIHQPSAPAWHAFLTGFPRRWQDIPVAEVRRNANQWEYRPYGETGGRNSLWMPLRNPEVIGGAITFHKTFWLGTDRFGRDLLSRMIVASRVSISVGLIAVFISLLIGISLGAMAGYFRGLTDKVILWFINVIWSIPTLLLVVAISMALGKGFVQVFVAVGLTMWVEVARLVRGQFFSLREQQFVEAGKALGYRNPRIIFRHILPNITGPVIVIAASNFASAILLEAGLSFLGMGAQPPTPSWGMMIKENYGYIVMDAAWLAIIPGLAIALLVLAFTLFGNGLRDAFDVKARMT